MNIDPDTIRVINAIANVIVALSFLFLCVIAIPVSRAVRNRLAEVSDHTEAVRKLLIANIFITDQMRDPDTLPNDLKDRP